MSENRPLEVYASSEMAVALINSKQIEAQLQAEAKFAHGVTIKEELKKWKSHST